jgi:phosphoglycolate phosphatase
MACAFDLVMFDLDGTLVATAPEICDAVNDCLRHFQLAQVTLAQVSVWIGNGTKELLLQALGTGWQMGADPVRASAQLSKISLEFSACYLRRCGTNSQLYPHVRDVLTSLRRQGVNTALVTNKEGRYTDRVLSVHQLDSLFDCVVSGDTLANKKPDPGGIAHCLEKFGTVRKRALFVGDSYIDVATARNAGVTVWVVPYGYNMSKAIAESAPARIIADCSFLLEPGADLT